MSYSIQRATSDGTLSQIVVGIKFFDQSHISVFVDGVLADGVGEAQYNHIWINSNTIQITPVVPAGKEVLLARKTPNSEVFNDFSTNAVFNSQSMDNNFDQLLFITQEASERNLVSDFYNDVDMHGYKIINLGTAVNRSDAINLGQYQDDALGAQQSAERAEEAARRAEAAASGNDGANALVDCVKFIEPNKTVWWKNAQSAPVFYLYDGTSVGTTTAILQGDGNISGPSYTGSWGNSLIQRLNYAGVGTNIVSPNHYSTHLTGGNGRCNFAWKTQDGGAWESALVFQGSYWGLNFYGGHTAPGNYAPYVFRIQNDGIWSSNAVVAKGDVFAFNSYMPASGVATADLTDLYPNSTLLEASPTEFGILDILEKQAEIIGNAKATIQSLESALEALRARVGNLESNQAFAGI